MKKSPPTALLPERWPLDVPGAKNVPMKKKNTRTTTPSIRWKASLELHTLTLTPVPSYFLFPHSSFSPHHSPPLQPMGDHPLVLARFSKAELFGRLQSTFSRLFSIIQLSSCCLLVCVLSFLQFFLWYLSSPLCVFRCIPFCSCFRPLPCSFFICSPFRMALPPANPAAPEKLCDVHDTIVHFYSQAPQSQER